MPAKAPVMSFGGNASQTDPASTIGYWTNFAATAADLAAKVTAALRHRVTGVYLHPEPALDAIAIAWRLNAQGARYMLAAAPGSFGELLQPLSIKEATHLTEALCGGEHANLAKLVVHQEDYAQAVSMVETLGTWYPDLVKAAKGKKNRDNLSQWARREQAWRPSKSSS
jgi:hypothetical protein